jgi:hypothetical protein
MSATADLTELYKGSLQKAERGVAIAEQQYVIVRDEVETTGEETTLRWTLLSPASVKITGKNKAELTKNGKTLILEVREPGNIAMKTWPTDPS